MKTKTLLSLAILPLCTINCYADNNQSAVAVYTCKKDCRVVANYDKEHIFGCVDSNGKFCEYPKYDIFVSEKNTIPGIPTMTPATQEKTEPVAARAGKINPRAAKKTTSKPNSSTPTGPDKAAGGDVYIRCPDGCSLECNSVGGGQSSICVCKRGSSICDEEVTQIGAPQSF